VIIGIGTRYSDFTTGSRTTFQNQNVQFININIASFDAFKHGSSLPVVADAREALIELTEALAGYQVADDYREEYGNQKKLWDTVVDEAFEPKGLAKPSQTEIIGAVIEASAAEDTLVCAAGSLPGDLHKLWRVRSELGYHVEYAFSTMGYEIAAGIGVARAKTEGDSIVMVGDGSYLMMHTELVSAVAENIKFITVLIQNHGYASIGHLSETIGSQRYGTKYRYRDESGNNFETRETLPIDLATNAESLGVKVWRIEETASAIGDLKKAIREAKAHDGPSLIHLNSDPLLYSPSGEGWWEVPVAPVSNLDSTQKAYEAYLKGKSKQKPLLG
jgi:3D-(3,5/4)-trihydroxycyclohexane-1,2-dione acylhydrolase (decyclizing)